MLPGLPCFISHHPPTPRLYTLSLLDALPISPRRRGLERQLLPRPGGRGGEPTNRPLRSAPALEDTPRPPVQALRRSEEHTSELQSLRHLVCRLLLEKKKKSSSNPQNRRNAYH